MLVCSLIDNIFSHIRAKPETKLRLRRFIEVQVVFSRTKPAKKPPELHNRRPLAGLDERKRLLNGPELDFWGVDKDAVFRVSFCH